VLSSSGTTDAQRRAPGHPKLRRRAFSSHLLASSQLQSPSASSLTISGEVHGFDGALGPVPIAIPCRPAAVSRLVRDDHRECHIEHIIGVRPKRCMRDRRDIDGVYCVLGEISDQPAGAAPCNLPVKVRLFIQTTKDVEPHPVGMQEDGKSVPSSTAPQESKRLIKPHVRFPSKLEQLSAHR